MQQKRARRGSGDATEGLTGVSATATAERLTIGTTSVATRLEGGWEVIFHLGRTAHGRYDVTRLEVRPAGGPCPRAG